MAFPVIGCVLYYFVEVFPTSRESRKAEKAARAIAKAFDPDKSLREKAANLLQRTGREAEAGEIFRR